MQHLSHEDDEGRVHAESLADGVLELRHCLEVVEVQAVLRLHCALLFDHLLKEFLIKEEEVRRVCSFLLFFSSFYFFSIYFFGLGSNLVAEEEESGPSSGDGRGVLASEQECNHHTSELLVSQLGSVFVLALSDKKEDERVG